MHPVEYIQVLIFSAWKGFKKNVKQIRNLLSSFEKKSKQSWEMFVLKAESCRLLGIFLLSYVGLPSQRVIFNSSTIHVPHGLFPSAIWAHMKE